MKVITEICPRCKKRTEHKTDVDNIYSYTDETVYKKCPKCKKLKDTPEEKLLRAIFGEQQDSDNKD